MLQRIEQQHDPSPKVDHDTAFAGRQARYGLYPAPETMHALLPKTMTIALGTLPKVLQQKSDES